MIENSTLRKIRRLIDENAKLSTPARDLAPDADLYQAGLTPFMAIRLMLALEREFGVEFPEQMLKRRSMSSLEAVCNCVRALEQRKGLPKAA
ncbi:MAG TPA: acyl carrier protein [Methylocystis sp.]|nr:acyl carrier protein [Methylocystis sp.]